MKLYGPIHTRNAEKKKIKYWMVLGHLDSANKVSIISVHF